jgi:hypothetical protein
MSKYKAQKKRGINLLSSRFSTTCICFISKFHAAHAASLLILADTLVAAQLYGQRWKLRRVSRIKGTLLFYAFILVSVIIDKTLQRY